ncbi:18948_t:CDS:1, partial [Dentiscutata erythropus]
TAYEKAKAFENSFKQNSLSYNPYLSYIYPAHIGVVPNQTTVNLSSQVHPAIMIALFTITKPEDPLVKLTEAITIMMTKMQENRKPP